MDNLDKINRLLELRMLREHVAETRAETERRMTERAQWRETMRGYGYDWDAPSPRAEPAPTRQSEEAPMQYRRHEPAPAPAATPPEPEIFTEAQNELIAVGFAMLRDGLRDEFEGNLAELRAAIAEIRAANAELRAENANIREKAGNVQILRPRKASDAA